MSVLFNLLVAFVRWLTVLEVPRSDRHLLEIRQIFRYHRAACHTFFNTILRFHHGLSWTTKAIYAKRALLNPVSHLSIKATDMQLLLIHVSIYLQYYPRHIVSPQSE